MEYYSLISQQIAQGLLVKMGWLYTEHLEKIFGIAGIPFHKHPYLIPRDGKEGKSIH